MKLIGRFTVWIWFGLFSFQSLIAADTSSLYDITSEVRGRSDQPIPLTGGRVAQFKTPLAPPYQIIFEDLVPGANWAHPAKLKLISQSRVVEEIKTLFPPANLEAGKVLRMLVPPTPVEFKINDFQGTMKVKEPQKFYAVFINGKADRRHWNDFSFFYRVLTQVYGYSEANIYVADGAFIEKQPDLDGNGSPDIKYKSDIATVKELMTTLKDKMKKDDHLLLAINDHGALKDGESTIVLSDGDMKASEFATLLQAIPSERVLGIFEQCFSGGFVRPSVASKRVAMSAATNNEYSWASMDMNFDEFIYHVISAFARQTHDGKEVHSDLNRDALVSAQEAFSYALGKDRRPESPLLEAFKNSSGSVEKGIGH